MCLIDGDNNNNDEGDDDDDDDDDDGRRRLTKLAKLQKVAARLIGGGAMGARCGASTRGTPNRRGDTGQCASDKRTAGNAAPCTCSICTKPHGAICWHDAACARRAHTYYNEPPSEPTCTHKPTKL